MRKTGLLAVMACILALLSAGCGVGEPPAPDAEPVPDVRDGQPAEYPEAVAAAVKSLRPLHAGTTVVDGGTTYFIVSDAEPAPGYGVEITDIETDGDRAVVTVGIIEPEPGAAPVDAASHPHAVEARDGVYTEVQFQHTDGEYFPRVVGLDKPLSLIDRSENIVVGSLTSAGGRVHACGLARVFEATVSYELRDADGQVLQRGFTTAAAGGPDWGYYELTIDDAPPQAVNLVIYQAGAKDGSPLDVVELPVVCKRG